MKVKINNFEMGFDMLGAGEETFVLIHGFGLNRTIWRDVVGQYLTKCRTIMPDVRGHGESQATRDVYTMSLLAEDIVRLLDHLGIEKAIIAGHSMGGYITLAFADLFPDRLSGMGLITTRANRDDTQKRAGRHEMIKAVEKKGAFALAESLAPILTTDKGIAEKIHAMITQTDSQGIVSALRGMAERPDRRELLPSINVPTLVVAGEDDRLIPVEEAKAMVQMLPQGKLLSISGCGHLPMLETPNSLGEGLSDLLVRVSK